jgi:uncharacterized protein (DUF169 family)
LKKGKDTGLTRRDFHRTSKETGIYRPYGKGGVLKTLEEYKGHGLDLYHKLHLSTYPIAIKYIESADEIPEGAMRPSALGEKMALCQAFTLSRRWGTLVAMTSDDNFCTPATAIHKWEDIALEDLIESQVRQGWHKDLEAEKRRFKATSGFFGDHYAEKLSKYMGFICSPLPKTTFIPDSILVYCDGVQLTHITHALTYEFKHVPVSSFEGFGESCIKGGLLPFVTQKPQVVIPGAGDRSFAAISEHEMGIGIPAFLLFYIIENLFKAGGSMNLGFPMKSMLPMGLSEKLTPGFQFLREKMEKQSSGS